MVLWSATDSKFEWGYRLRDKDEKCGDTNLIKSSGKSIGPTMEENANYSKLKTEQAIHLLGNAHKHARQTYM